MVSTSSKKTILKVFPVILFFSLALTQCKKASVEPVTQNVTVPSKDTISAPDRTALKEILIQHSPEVSKLCDDILKATKKMNWKINPCAGVDWKVGGHSVQGRPILYAEFGDLESTQNVNLIFAMVHGDEVTPLYLGFELAQWLKQNVIRFPHAKIVVAPLVNPDGFFKSPRTRMNAKGVDCNRNFPTQDWPKRALLNWKTRFRSDPRRYPGMAPASEPETLFQMDLIKKVHPVKILSIHSPLNFLDYDGPSSLSLDRFPNEYVRESLKLRSRLRAISGGFYPGSLGNFAGRELGIPTLTLELPTANSRMAEAYWKKFSEGIRTMIEFSLPDKKEKLK